MIYDVIVVEDGSSDYQGDNWIHALGSFFSQVSTNRHVVLWENGEPVREYHPELGHGSDMSAAGERALMSVEEYFLTLLSEGHISQEEYFLMQKQELIPSYE